MNEKKRKSLSAFQIKTLLSIQPTDITLDKLKELFAFKQDGEPLIPMNSEFIFTDKMLSDAKSPVVRPEKRMVNTVTTAGRFIVNLFLFSNSNIRPHMSYINEPFNKSIIKYVEGRMALLLLEQKISSDDVVDFINREQWLGFATTSFTTPSMESSIIAPIPAVQARKKELFEKHKKAIANKDVNVVSKIEKELLDLSREKLKESNSTGIGIYDSGARGSFGNNYKNVNVMRGAMVESRDPSKFAISQDNLSDGISPEEVAINADQMVSASFARAISTQEGGYIVKQFIAAFSHIKLMDEGSNCGTVYGMPIAINENSLKDYHLRYVAGKDGLTLITEDFVKANMGKKFMMRSPLYCKTPDVCNKCAGDLYYRLGTKNIGNLLSRVGSTILNASLKQFHNKTIVTKEIDLNDLISEV